MKNIKQKIIVMNMDLRKNNNFHKKNDIIMEKKIEDVIKFNEKIEIITIIILIKNDNNKKYLTGKETKNNNDINRFDNFTNSNYISS